MIFSDRISDRLEQHRLTGSRRSDDQGTLAFTDGRHEVDDTSRNIIRRRLHIKLFVRIERREIIKKYLFTRSFRSLKIDGLDLDECKVTLAFFRRTYLARNSVTSAKIKFAYLRRRDINIIRAGQIVVFRGSQKSESVRQSFENAFGKDEAAFLGLSGENLEYQLLLSQARRSVNAHILGDMSELADRFIFQTGEIQYAVVGFAVIGL